MSTGNEVFDRCPTIGCGGDARYAAPGRGHIPSCGYPASIPEPVVAPLPSEAVDHLAKVVADALALPGWIVGPNVEDHAVARAVLAAGYRLIPEDDEDTVRVPTGATLPEPSLRHLEMCVRLGRTARRTMQRVDLEALERLTTWARSVQNQAPTKEEGTDHG